MQSSQGECILHFLSIEQSEMNHYEHYVAEHDKVFLICNSQYFSIYLT